ncbi:hypothetical protein [Methanocella paludicola]|nr:hypothetical protein [Methanocella paludicola]
MASKKEAKKSDGEELLEAAIFGIALGIAAGAIALYLNQKKEQEV